MKNARILLIVTFVLLLLGSATVPAAACSCAPGTPADHLGYADVVFVGEVTEIDEPFLSFSSADPVNVRFAVSETWMADVPATVTVQTALGGATCGYSFTVGSTYLVYASNSEGVLTTGLCSGTKLESDARADRDFLGQSMAPGPAVADESPPARFLFVIGIVMVAGIGMLTITGVVLLILRRRE